MASLEPLTSHSSGISSRAAPVQGPGPFHCVRSPPRWFPLLSSRPVIPIFPIVASSDSAETRPRPVKFQPSYMTGRGCCDRMAPVSLLKEVSPLTKRNTSPSEISFCAAKYQIQLGRLLSTPRCKLDPPRSGQKYRFMHFTQTARSRAATVETHYRRLLCLRPPSWILHPLPPLAGRRPIPTLALDLWVAGICWKGSMPR